MKQFFYSRRQPLPPKQGETEIQWETFTDSFNLAMVIRSYEYEKGKLYVLLNDGHEQADDVQATDAKGKPVIQRKRNWVCSEIYLNEEDTIRFRETA
jgi:hypothetical protein